MVELGLYFFGMYVYKIIIGCITTTHADLSILCATGLVSRHTHTLAMCQSSSLISL